MRHLFKTAAILLVMAFIVQGAGAALAAESRNPLVVPSELAEYVETPDHFVNILLLGLDLGFDGYRGSANKKAIEQAHTDSVMVIAINLDRKEIDLISLPRDTVTYVPGVKGVYKLNAAVHCADTFDEGLKKTISAVEWLLGDIQIEYYFAVDMGTMIKIGDAIGGVDMELEMNYIGHSGTRYYKGMQHLDGYGITDYLRARTNATVNYNDIGRTNRNRQTMLAIFKKLRTDRAAVLNLIQTAASAYDSFYTNATTDDIADLIAILPMILSVDPDTIGLHVFDGRYRTSNGWNFTFTDQDVRLSVIQEVYGVTAEPLEYVSYKYQQWLDDWAGYSSVHYISVAQEMIAYIDEYGLQNLTPQRKEAYDNFMDAYDVAVFAFELASDTMSEADSAALYNTRVKLRETADELNRLFGYSVDLLWGHNTDYWYNDSYINEYQFDWR